MWDWRDGSAVRNTCCSFRGSKIHSQDLHQEAHSTQNPSSGLCEHRQACAQACPLPTTCTQSFVLFLKKVATIYT